ncbi:hypothetical protein RRG08_025241 [Elysia crispata]|uniref:Uncharacterized protein n=1 Tax=Elysia crispata TaxID=231223 RepID=A0AAE1ACA0_9GAST|nr:hypothetical protein RRG08_025241 [Elysia crispata]
MALKVLFLKPALTCPRLLFNSPDLKDALAQDDIDLSIPHVLAPDIYTILVQVNTCLPPFLFKSLTSTQFLL